jgi:hypothetical protein
MCSVGIFNILQCIRKVLRRLDFFHILLHYSLFLKLIHSFSPLINLHTIPHDDKAKNISTQDKTQMQTVRIRVVSWQNGAGKQQVKGRQRSVIQGKVSTVRYSTAGRLGVRAGRLVKTGRTRKQGLERTGVPEKNTLVGLMTQDEMATDKQKTQGSTWCRGAEQTLTNRALQSYSIFT